MSTSRRSTASISSQEQSSAYANDRTARRAEQAAVKSIDRITAATSKRRVALVAAFAVWGLAITVGSLYGYWYESTPAETGIVRDRWPAESACILSASRPTLLMFVHPRCPCSRASLSELALLMTHCQDRVSTEVMFFTPRSVSEDWGKTDLWESATRIPGVLPRLDLGGDEHRRFGARVSGEVFLFQPSGELSFHGGITAGRGHSGDNQGRATLESFLLDRQLPTKSTPVFGCQLESPSPLRQKHGVLTETGSGP